MTDLFLTKRKLPSHLHEKANAKNAFSAASFHYGFPVISIGGKVFHIRDGDERELVATLDDPNEPEHSIEVVIIGVNNAKSKVFYEKGYLDGVSCFSVNGFEPSKGAERPRSEKCSICPHNQWSSYYIGTKAQSLKCGDCIRLTVCLVGQMNNPMLLCVPAKSLKHLGAYGAKLAKHSCTPDIVITKIGFDDSASYPLLTFKATRFVDEEQVAKIEACKINKAEVISHILGTNKETGSEIKLLLSEYPCDVESPLDLLDLNDLEEDF